MNTKHSPGLERLEFALTISLILLGMVVVGAILISS